MPLMASLLRPPLPLPPWGCHRTILAMVQWAVIPRLSVTQPLRTRPNASPAFETQCIG